MTARSWEGIGSFMMAMERRATRVVNRAAPTSQSPNSEPATGRTISLRLKLTIIYYLQVFSASKSIKARLWLMLRP